MQRGHGAALYHNSGLCKGQENNGLRHQKTQRADRPGAPSELEPQRLFVQCSPALSLPLFTDQEYDTVDVSSLKLFSTQSLVANNEGCLWCELGVDGAAFPQCSPDLLVRHLLCVHAF